MQTSHHAPGWNPHTNDSDTLEKLREGVLLAAWLWMLRHGLVGQRGGRVILTRIIADKKRIFCPKEGGFRGKQDIICAI